MSDIYYDPEKFGLEIVGEIGEHSWSYDLLVVWRDKHGQLYYGEDSGCSCTYPFAGDGVDDLTPCTTAELQNALEIFNSSGYREDESMAIVDIMVKATQ